MVQEDLASACAANQAPGGLSGPAKTDAAALYATILLLHTSSLGKRREHGANLASAVSFQCRLTL